MSGVQWMVVLIVLICVWGGIAKNRSRSAKRHEEEPQGDPEAGRLREEVRTLKDRIAVLERIATDRSSSLDHEIERLRDR